MIEETAVDRRTIAWLDDQARSAKEITDTLSEIVIVKQGMVPLGEAFNLVAVPVNPTPAGDLLPRAWQELSERCPNPDLVMVDLSFDNENKPSAVEYGRRLASHIRTKAETKPVGVYTKHRLRPRYRALVGADRFSLLLEEIRQMYEGPERLDGDDWYDLFDGVMSPKNERPLPGRRSSESARTPAAKPRAFIGCSVESTPIAEAIQRNLQFEVLAAVWPQAEFQVSVDVLHSLLGHLENYDFGVFVLSPDDVSEIRKMTVATARDNVIFELGLFVGRHGRERTFIVTPRNADMHLPTDLLGMAPATYDINDVKASHEDLPAALGPACGQIKSAMRRVLEAPDSP